MIINEFGEVGLDHLLVAHSDQHTVLLESGCVCAPRERHPPIRASLDNS